MNRAIKQLTEQSETANIAAHVLWGAIEAELAGGKASTGAVAADAAEIGARVLTQGLYEKEPHELTTEEKAEVLELSKVLAGLASGAVNGGSSVETLNAVSTGVEVAKNAVENNHFGDDISPTEDRKQTVEMFAKTLFKDKENAEELAETYYDALQMGEAKSLVEGVKGTVEAITNLDETVATLANILQDPKGTFDKVIISAEQWNKQLNWALENDPVLAAEMQGYMVGAGKSLEMPSLLLTGEAAKVFQKVVKNHAVGEIKTTDVRNLGVNNAKFNYELNSIITQKSTAIHTQKTQQRVSEIAHQFNNKSVEPKNMKVTINGQTYATNPRTSIGAPVFQGVSDQNVISYYKEISGVDKLPSPQIIPKMKDLNGNSGKVWTIKPQQGPLKGSTINLRNFSTSQNDTNAKYTIEIIQPKDNKTWVSGIKSRKIEIKFQN
ncbi:VENN motif pre-toxin domain-containing protein [Actinobacillus capsulatus]|uniref:VENN motif pre-toxin domain-containing protein n=1 Tax=Actinobacillus capsulatus TaxID=717 RepID=UPI000369D624|nr:VENN motif pre-toxin domain-containing protein [Actinobacillus capsulatus]